jgi:hypothetical protein
LLQGYGAGGTAEFFTIPPTTPGAPSRVHVSSVDTNQSGWVASRGLQHNTSVFGEKLDVLEDTDVVDVYDIDVDADCFEPLFELVDAEYDCEALLPCEADFDGTLYARDFLLELPELS